MKKTISKVLMCLGAYLVFGIAGDSDTNRHPFWVIMLTVIIGLLLCLVGYIIYKKVNTPKQKPESDTLKNNELFVNSRQATTPAYNNILPQQKGNVNNV